MKDQSNNNGTFAKTKVLDTECLEGWKSIAVYFNRTVRTVQRWEKTEGLPAHRHKHHKAGSVYAYKSELDIWWNNKQLSLNQTQDEDEAEGNAALNKNFTDPENSTKIPLRTKQLFLGKTKLFAVLFCSVIIAISIFFLTKQARKPLIKEKARLVILPFKNLSSELEQDWLNDGLTEEMITRMGNLYPDKLGVIGLASVTVYKESSKSPAEIGRELNADYVLENSIRQDENKILIETRLIEVKNQTQIWSKSFDRNVQNMLLLENEIAMSVGQALAPHIIQTSTIAYNQATVNNSEAYEAYLKGRYLWHKNTGESLTKSIIFFETAVKLDPTFAQGWAALANAYAKMGILSFNAPKDCFPQANEAAKTALQLNPSLAEAHAVTALVKLYWDWDWNGAEKSFLRAIELNPSLASNYQSYAFFLTAMGRHDEAIIAINRARELEPLSAAINDKVGWFYYVARRYDEAIMDNLKAIELEPQSIGAQNNLRMAYMRKGMIEEARQAEIRFLRMTGKEKVAEEFNSSNPLEALKNFNRIKLKLLDSPKNTDYVSSSYRISLLTELNDRESFFQSLETAYKDHDSIIPLLNVHPMFDHFKTDPRFIELLNRVNLNS